MTDILERLRALTYQEEDLEEAADEIERLRIALKKIDECYVDKFGGAIQGLRDDIPLSRPCQIARAALHQQLSADKET